MCSGVVLLVHFHNLPHITLYRLEIRFLERSRFNSSRRLGWGFMDEILLGSSGFFATESVNMMSNCFRSLTTEQIAFTDWKFT